MIDRCAVLLAGDIGATHARLRLLSPNGRVVRHEDLESRKCPSLEAAIRQFLGDKPPRVTSAAFGLPGPVVNERFVATNLPWRVDARVLSRRLHIRHVTLLNDLVAIALGALGARANKLVELGGAGLPKKTGTSLAVLAAGTGLGQAMLVWDGERHVPCATEGGHSDFSPKDDLEVDLLRFLRARFGHVSWERVLSGGGLGNLYDFFVQAKGMAEDADNAHALGAASDRNALICRLGIEGRSEPAARAVELFGALYGAEAGNLALKALAIGGVYVCGNIAAHLRPILEGGAFRRAFVAKGRLAPLLERVPVALVVDANVGLAGATRVAMTRVAAKK